MTKHFWFQTPVYAVGVAILVLFFLSCTKKPTPPTTAQIGVTSPRTPAAAVPKGMFTTAHGYKVQLEPAQFGNPPSSKQ